MNSTAVGDILEKKIFDLLESEINADRFWAKKSNCKIFRKKGYFSRDRQSEIIFDVSIEVYLPSSEDYSLLILFECKNYSHSVPVDDIEEFFAKVQQVGAANSKAVLASIAAFQSGTMEFARSKGVGLLRYFDADNFKWELFRSPSAGAHSSSAARASLIKTGLSDPDFRSELFDLYMLSQTRATNSLWDFVEDLVVDGSLSSAQIRRIANSRNRLVSSVPFLETGELEARAENTLMGIGYISGEIALEEICERETDRSHLQILTNISPVDAGATNPVLGRISFRTLQIEIYAQSVPNRARDRFTLSHELAHHLLGHGQYLERDACDESDFVLTRARTNDGTGIARMEFQANYFAASLLMPRTNFISDFQRIVNRLEIPNRGFAPLYVDNQPCNLQNFNTVTDVLMSRYDVSRTAAKIRLESLGLLCDARALTGPQSIHSVLLSAFTT